MSTPAEHLQDPASIAGYAHALEMRILFARQDINTFIELVMRDERTGHTVEQAPVHISWHQMAEVHPRLVIWSHVESGKTNQMSIARTLFALGKDPSTRVVIVSNTYVQAEKIVRTVAKYIESNEMLKRIFPHIEKADPWSSTQLFIRRPVTSKDASVQAIGVHGNILGARIDLLILDDVLDYENCRTPHMRADLWDWYHATLAGRLTEDAKVIVIGTAFHPEDFLHRAAVQPGWTAVRYPVVDDHTGAPRWPERWSLTRILAKREELGPLEFARQMLCMARADDEARFKREWIDLCLHRGRDKTMAWALAQVPNGCKVYTGVDLAVQRHSSADLTVLFTVIVHPNGDREVLNIDAGRWTGPEIVDLIIKTHHRYQSLVIVENNAAQDFILQFTRHQSAVPLRAFTTGSNKAHPEFGVESIAAEMAQGKWIIPCQGGVKPEVDAWIRELLYYDPKGHTGDRLMASWFAREGARLGVVKAEVGRIDLLRR